ncbi:MAG: type IV secretory system conjugative DNA transfer family protein, partial [Lachnospiraceae bacterium]|nr:type IV secretory system conjugative DNA transfer family protein [Lachnospiraceae bacterium]
MTQKQIKRILILALPYVIMGLVATNLGEAWRLATGGTSGEKIMSLMYTIPQAFGNPLPSFHPFDLVVGLCCGGGLKLAVYLRGKNAKKYRHNQEFGSARWGNAKDIERFVNPKFQENVILTQTERLTMESRAKNPTDSRNKN